MKYAPALLTLSFALALRSPAQTGGATFGEVIPLGGTPSDVVLDESRMRLYLVNQNANRIDIYDYAARRVIGQIQAGSRPVAAAMSPDNRFLYVTNNQTASLSVIDLATASTVRGVSLPAAPEGVEVGFDGRVLITTQGTADANNVNSLVLYDPNQSAAQQVTAVSFPPPPPTPTPLSTVTIGRPSTTFRGKLIRTPDAQFIIGMSVVNNGAQTVLFVYEAASGTVLRSRTVTGQSTVLSVSPDGSRFMAGFTLYDTATLNVIAQYHTANVPFPLTTGTTQAFNLVQNQGGSSFSPDGETIYSAFNVAPVTTPPTRPQASTLLISNSRHLGVRLGIKLPESVVARMVVTSDGKLAWGLSESGLIQIPLGTLFDHPILEPASTTVFLSSNDCNRGLARGFLEIRNRGKGKLTFSVPDTTAALIANVRSGVAPSTIEFTMEPGRTGVTRQYGTNLYTGGATNQGAALLINLASPEAINIPPTIKVFMNNRQPDQRGIVIPVETGTTASEGIYDILVDELRDRVYLLNSGFNRIDVYDRSRQTFLAPIEVGQLPHQMALAGDRRRLYVANSGGESISIVDLDARRVIGSVRFPPRPRAGNSTPVTPQAIAAGISGVQVIMSDGSKWRITGEEAATRPVDAVTPLQFTVTGNNGPVRMVAAPDGTSIVAMAGNGTSYLYDGMADEFTVSSRPYTATQLTGYHGPLTVSPGRGFIAANGFIFSGSLAAIGGSESPSSTPLLPLASRRNVAALAAVDEFRFLRLTTPVKQTILSTPSGDARPALELVDLRDSSVSLIGALAEQPVTSVFGTARVNVPPRQLAVDQQGTAYAVTLSGLTVIPLVPAGATRPAIAAGPNAMVNAQTGASQVFPGSFVIISGSHLASTATAPELPVPLLLGGSCVTLGDLQLPLLQTASGQILAQVPDTAPTGNHVLRVRSLATGQSSDPVMVTVSDRP